MKDETSNTWLHSIKAAGPHAIGWHDLVQLYGPFVRGILIRKGLQPACADDVLQNVMTIVVRKLPEFERIGSGAFRSWLREITANCLKDYVRSKQFRTRSAGGSEMIQLANELADPNSPLSGLWNREHARHVLDRLLDTIAGEFSPKTLKIFRRLAIDGCSVDDVAAELSTTANACFIARSRVMKCLREVYSEFLDGI